MDDLLQTSFNRCPFWNLFFFKKSSRIACGSYSSDEIVLNLVKFKTFETLFFYIKIRKSSLFFTEKCREHWITLLNFVATGHWKSAKIHKITLQGPDRMDSFGTKVDMLIYNFGTFGRNIFRDILNISMATFKELR